MSVLVTVTTHYAYANTGAYNLKNEHSSLERIISTVLIINQKRKAHRARDFEL